MFGLHVAGTGHANGTNITRANARKETFMAKVSIVGNNLVVKSKYSLEDLKFLQRCNSRAMQLTTEIDGEVTTCFAIGISSSPDISNHGITFSEHDHSDSKLATATFPLPQDLDDVKVFVSKEYAPCLVQLGKLEDQIGDCLADLNAARELISSSIDIL